MNQTLAYPLQWPEGWKSTPAHRRRRASYKVSQDHAQRELADEVRLLGGRHMVISTNIPVRQDGMPYARYPKVTDPGVACYFLLNDRQRVIACDQWDLVKDNVRAVGLSVAALRMLKRCGTSTILERAFQGFDALPAPGHEEHWTSVLELPRHGATIDEVEKQFRILAQECHPDREGGDVVQFQRLVAARKKAREALNSRGNHVR